MKLTAVLLFLAAAAPRLAFAQNPPDAPPPSWAGSLSAGLAMTGGNTDTTTFNLAFDVQSDKTKRNVIKAEGLSVRSSQDGDEIVDRLSLSGRDEYRLGARAYVFGQMQYLRDQFKRIDYLLSPTAGVGYRVIDTELATLSADVSVGGLFEKNPGLELRSSGAVTFTEKASRKLGSATATQSLNALWDAGEFEDALYTFQVGLAADVVRNLQLKVDFIDAYKTRPPDPTIQKNDTTFMTSVAFKF